MGTVWVTDRFAIKNIHIVLIRSVLDYGRIVFGSVACVALKKVIQNSGSSIVVVLRGSQVNASVSISGGSWGNASSSGKATKSERRVLHCNFRYN